jgi:acyl-CoA thioesterase I
MLLRKNDHILFYGDSITDAGRCGENNNWGLGNGYVSYCAGLLAARYPELDLRITNRGISGNRVYDLENRLQADVVDLKATVVSVMIGINDTWRRYDSKIPSPIPDFEASYRRMLATIVQKLAARLVICEPFLLPIPADRVAWREDLDPRIAAVRRLAVEFKAVFVPLDGVFAAAACRQKMDYWLPDGVHPTPAGHALIAEEWLHAATR